AEQRRWWLGLGSDGMILMSDGSGFNGWAHGTRGNMLSAHKPPWIEQPARVQRLAHAPHQPMIVARLAPDRQSTLPGDRTMGDHEVAIRCHRSRAQRVEEVGCSCQFHFAQMMSQDDTVTGVGLQQ